MNLSTLDTLPIGGQATISHLTDDKQFHYLLEMGCMPGQQVIVLHRAPFGGPLAVELSGYRLVLRRTEAKHVVVKTLAI